MFNARHRFLLIAFLLAVLGMSTNAWAKKPVCGDGKCSGGETAASCPADCPTSSYCGDGSCDANETNETCPTDCSAASFCGDGTCDADETNESCSADCEPPPPSICVINGVCNAGEDCIGCPLDCAGLTTGKPGGRYCCGADTCEAGMCGGDCGVPVVDPYCGDGNVDPGEQCDDGGETASCDSNCSLALCGDGTLNHTADEQCDDGNTNPGDGCDANCQVESPVAQIPLNQFNIGDSIGEGEAADGTIGKANHQAVWSTGYDAGDSVNSLNERFESVDATGYYENNAPRDPVFNHAVSGAVMADFATQANGIVAAAQSSTPSGEAGMTTVFLGSNDVCAASLDDMTDPVMFENQYRAGLDVLANSLQTSSSQIHVSSIPALYWLWTAKRNNFWCLAFAWPFVPCENLLDNPADDCASTASRLDPDNIHEGDGGNCIRRKDFHKEIRDTYNPILRDVLQEYKDNGKLTNADFIDIFDVQFEDSHVNGGDCFHPSKAGHTLLAEKEWCRSQWGVDDTQCTP